MKKIAMSLLLFFAFAGSVFAHSVRVENRSSKDVKAKARCSGSTKEVVFRSSSTSTYTLHSSSSSDCEVKINGVSYTVPDRARIVIKSNGSIQVK